MGLEFITRLIKTTAVLALVVALYLVMYYSGMIAVGFLIGVAWSLINLFFIRGLVIQLINPDKPRKDIAVVLGMVKFPILYVVGYFIVASDYFSVYALLSGFSLIFPVALLKVLGRIFLGLDAFGFEKKHVEGAH